MHRATGDPHVRQAIEFFFDFGSPTSYLAGRSCRSWRPTPARQLSDGRCCSAACSRPPATHSPVMVPAKGRWMGEDLQRWARALRRAVPAQPALPDQHADADARRRRPADARAGALRALRRAVFHAMWVEPRTWATRRCSLRRSARPASTPKRSWRWSAMPEVKAQLMANTEDAVARGVFGAPTFFVGERDVLRPGSAGLRARGRHRRLNRRARSAARPGRPTCRSSPRRGSAGIHNRSGRPSRKRPTPRRSP